MAFTRELRIERPPCSQLMRRTRLTRAIMDHRSPLTSMAATTRPLMRNSGCLLTVMLPTTAAGSWTLRFWQFPMFLFYQEHPSRPYCLLPASDFLTVTGKSYREDANLGAHWTASPRDAIDVTPVWIIAFSRELVSIRAGRRSPFLSVMTAKSTKETYAWRAHW